MNRNLDVAKTIGSAIVGGAVAGGVLWWFVNRTVMVNGQGLLERHGGPLQVLWAGVAAGAVVGAVVGAVQHAIRRRRRGALASLAASTGMAYQEDASDFLARHKGLRAMPLFTDLASASDLTTGTHHGGEFGAFELTTVRSHDGSESTTKRATVVVMPNLGLPEFHVGPRGVLMNLVAAVGGVEPLSFDASAVADPTHAEVVRQFERSFLVSPLDSSTNTSRDPQRIEAIRRMISVELMRCLTEAPGWSIQSHGGHLALARAVGRGSAGVLTINGLRIPVGGWGQGRMDRASLIDQALAIRQVLETSARSTGPMVPGGNAHDVGVMQARLRRRGVLAIAGAVLGFFGGFAGFASLMISGLIDVAAKGGLMLAAFPLAIFGGLTLGVGAGLGVERLLPDPRPIRRSGASQGKGIIGSDSLGGGVGMVLGFMLGGFAAIGILFGAEGLGFKLGRSWFMPILLFGSAAVGASSGLLAGTALSDRIARRREHKNASR